MVRTADGSVLGIYTMGDCMKRIIEIKRGEPVPSNAKWLKDVVRLVGTNQEFFDDGMCQGYEDVDVYVTFDVFEVEEVENGGSP